jgi:hypothetical protein
VSEPRVSIQTRVGDGDGSTPDLEAATLVLARLWDQATPTPTPTDPAHSVASAPTDAAHYMELVHAIRTLPMDDLGAPARNLAIAPSGRWPVLRGTLLATRKKPTGEYRSLLSVIGGDVPNRYGYFALAWKKAHGHRVRLSEDWFEDLLTLPSGRVSGPLRPVYRDCVLTTALLRASARIGATTPELTGDVVEALLDAAYLHRGTFRDEVGRALQSIGDEAIAHLVRAAIPPKHDDKEKTGLQRAEYAAYNLDRMDRLHPERASKAVADEPRRLIALFDAYSRSRTPEAAGVLAAQLDAPEPSLRAAARKAFLPFVLGPAPRARHKKLRVLGGGTTTRAAGRTYRQAATTAIRDLVEQEFPTLLEPACRISLDDGTVDTVCEGQPDRLTHAFIEHADRRRQDRESAIVAQALAHGDSQVGARMLDEVLARGGVHGDSAPVVDFFLRTAERAREHGDVVRAAQLLRKTARLVSDSDPRTGRRLRAKALLSEASVPGLDRQGRGMLLSAALSVDPTTPGLSSAIASEAKRQRPEFDQEDRLSRAILLLLAGLGAVFLLGEQLRRRNRPEPS